MRRLLRTSGAILAAYLATAGATGVRAQEVQIGVAVPLSGPDAGFGAMMKAGAEQAATDVNAAGGILGHPVSLKIVDDGSDPKKGADVAKQLVDDKIRLVIGDFSSAVALASSAVYAQAGVLDIVPAAIAPQITERGLSNLFRLAGREDLQPDVATRFIAARRYARVALLYDRSSAGKAFIDAVRAGLSARGTQDVFYGSVGPETRDLSGTVARLRAAGTQIVVFGGGPAGAALVVRQLRDANARIPLLGSAAMASDDFAAQAGAAAEGTFMVFPQDPRSRPLAADLLRRLGERGSGAYDYFFYAHAAVQIIQQAAQSRTSLDPAILAAALHAGTTYKTAIGPVAFDAKGDPKIADFGIQVWRKGPTGRINFGPPSGS